MKKLTWITIFSFFVFPSCKSTLSTSGIKDDGKIDVTFLQINDVYEITPLQGGKVGGMARVATLKKELLAQNPNTFMAIAGDFVSPSVYNSLVYEGKRIRGAQMIAALNAAGTDFAVLGNHEFDINEKELQDRINESKFQWVSSNTFHNTSSGIKPFVKTTAAGSEVFPETYILNVEDADGTKAKIGFIGITLPFNKAPYVSYTDPLESAVKWYNTIKDSCDAVVALTHQAIAEDSILALRIPELAAIIGGHEHDMHYITVGKVPITKAHANAQSAFILRMTIDKKNKSVKVVPELKMIDPQIASDEATEKVVDKWTNIAKENYASLGFDASKVVLKSGDPLDGREIMIRSGQTNLTRDIVASIEKSTPEAKVAIFNSGSIRVDDILEMPVTQYDIIRSLPYGGTVVQVDMKGSLLTRILESGRNNVGSGGFLQYSSAITYDTPSKKWKLKNEIIDPDKIFRVAISDFLLTGGEANMGYLTKDNPEIIKIHPGDGRDLRLDIIKYLEGK